MILTYLLACNTHVLLFYIFVAVNNDSVSSPSTESPSQPTGSLHQTCDPGVVSSAPAIPVSSSNDGSPVTEYCNLRTADTVASGVSLTSATDETDHANIPGMFAELNLGIKLRFKNFQMFANHETLVRHLPVSECFRIWQIS